MCDPITFAVSAGVAAYGLKKQDDARKDAARQMKKQQAIDRGRARDVELSADTDARKERRDSYKTRRAGQRAGQTATAGTAQSFGPRSFFSPA